MTLKQKWGLNRLELWATVLLATVGFLAVADGLRLLAQGPQAASWTAVYIMASGFILVLLAVASLLPSSRDAAAGSISSTVADDVLENDGDASSEPVMDEELPPKEARSLLLRAVILLIGWVLILQVIGYIAATAIFLFVYGLLVSRHRVKPTLVLSVIATATSTGLFQAIGIRLPAGYIF